MTKQQLEQRIEEIKASIAEHQIAIKHLEVENYQCIAAIKEINDADNRKLKLTPKMREAMATLSVIGAYITMHNGYGYEGNFAFLHNGSSQSARINPRIVEGLLVRQVIERDRNNEKWDKHYVISEHGRARLAECGEMTKAA